MELAVLLTILVAGLGAAVFGEKTNKRKSSSLLIYEEDLYENCKKMLSMILVGLLVVSGNSFAMQGSGDGEKEELNKKLKREGQGKNLKLDEAKEDVDPFTLLEDESKKQSKKLEASKRRLEIFNRIIEICKRDKTEVSKLIWKNICRYISLEEDLKVIEDLILYAEKNKKIDLENVSKEHVRFVLKFIEDKEKLANKKDSDGEVDGLSRQLSSLRMGGVRSKAKVVISGGKYLLWALTFILNKHYNYASPWYVFGGGLGIEGARQYFEEFGPSLLYLVTSCCGKRTTKKKKKE